jgi:hypothetical protein
MTSIFDILATALFIAAAGTFFFRLQREDPPLWPYVAVALGAAAANWLGEKGAGALALALIAAGATLLAYVASRPYRDEGCEK